MRVGTPGFQGARLEEALEVRGMTAVELHRRAKERFGCEISTQKLSQYQNGQGTPPRETLDMIGAVLGVPVAFFLMDPRECPEETIFYRKMSAATKRARIRAQWQLKWLQDIYADVSQFVSFPEANLPELGLSPDPLQVSFSEIEEAASRARAYWRLGDAPVGNMVRLLENQGVIVGRQELGAESLDGLSARDSNTGRSYILLGTDKGTAVRWRFDAAHELGHLLLHQNVDQSKLANPLMFKHIEDQAHHFARAFLLPLDPFSEDFFSAQLDVLRAMKPKWRVSIAAMIIRARDADLISEQAEQRLWMYLGRKKWRLSEPYDEDWLPEEPLLMRQALEMIFSSGLQTVDDLLAKVNLYAEDVEHIVGLPAGFLDSRFNSLRVIPRAGEPLPATGLPPGEVVPFMRRQQ